MARLGAIGEREILYTLTMARIGAWTHHAWQAWDGKDLAELGALVEGYARSANAILPEAMSRAKSATDSPS